MEIKRTTEIVVESERRYVVHHPENSELIICPSCSETMVTAEQAAIVLALSHRAVFQLVENGSVHFAETENGVLFVCLRSLAEAWLVVRKLAGEVL